MQRSQGFLVTTALAVKYPYCGRCLAAIHEELMTLFDHPAHFLDLPQFRSTCLRILFWVGALSPNGSYRPDAVPPLSPLVTVQVFI